MSGGYIIGKSVRNVAFSSFFTLLVVVKVDWVVVEIGWVVVGPTTTDQCGQNTGLCVHLLPMYTDGFWGLYGKLNIQDDFVPVKI